MIENGLKLIYKRVLILMAAYSFARIIFFFYNSSLFSRDSLGEILWAFVHGLRFDIYAILWVNIPFWILAFIPLEKIGKRMAKWWPRIEATVFGLWNLAFLGLSFTDAELYRFQSKRLSMEMMALKGDITDQAWSMIFYYWGLSLIMIATTLVLIYFYPRRKLEVQKRSWVRGALLGLVTLALMALGMRGGWQLKPIRPIHAFTAPTVDLANLALNSAFTVLRSGRTGEVKRSHYFADPKEVGAYVMKDMVPRPSLGTHKGGNAIIFILESFSLEYMGWPDGSQEQMPFLNKLAKESMFFPYHFANGRRSIDAVPSIVCGLPAMMLEPFATSNYQSHNVRCLAHVLRERGYKTLFFHGAQNGSMYIDSFARRAGFEKFYGNNEYPDPSQTDGHWGVYDGPFMDFALDEISDLNEPFVAVIFTLSSHHPYRIPEEWKGKLPKGTMEIHESLAYTDAMVAQFFEKAKSKAWFKDTVFVLTGDHTSKSEDSRFSGPLGVFRVPLVMYSGGADLPSADTQRFVQQADISPSILDLLGVDEPKFLRFGRSVFNQQARGRVLNYNSQGYWLLANSVFVQMDFDGKIINKGYWKGTPFMDKSIKAPDAEVDAVVAELKALVQYFNNGLLDNSWEDLSTWNF